MAADRWVRSGSVDFLPFFEQQISHSGYRFLYRPPLNLLRQEIAGTSIYLDILQKSTSRNGSDDEMAGEASPDGPSFSEKATVDGDLESVAEDKLVSFCGQILKDAAEVQSSSSDAASVDVHRALELRAPVIVKVSYSC